MRVETPRFALVQWPGKPGEPVDCPLCPPCCITLDAVVEAVRRGAVLLGREDDILTPFNAPRIESGFCDPGDENDARPC
jgi:hypothetical protein